MVIKKIIIAAAFLSICLASCDKAHNKSNSDTTTKDTLTNSNNMNSYISLFEIPATDITRAVNFYQSILDVKIEIVEMPDMQMGILPYENQAVTAVITKAEGYIPSADGVTIYLNGGNDLQEVLNKVENNGGKIQIPKTLHADENGYFAIFLDSEGNKIGLHSMN